MVFPRNVYIGRDSKLEEARVRYIRMEVRGLKVACINKGRGVCNYMSTILDKTLPQSREMRWNQVNEILMATTSSTEEKWKDFRKKIFSYKKHQILPRTFHIPSCTSVRSELLKEGRDCGMWHNSPQTSEGITNMWKQIYSHILLKNKSSKIVLKLKFKIKILKKDNRIVVCRLNFSGQKFLLHERFRGVYICTHTHIVIDVQKNVFNSKVLSINTDFFVSVVGVFLLLFLNTPVNWMQTYHHIRKTFLSAILLGYLIYFCLTAMRKTTRTEPCVYCIY